MIRAGSLFSGGGMLDVAVHQVLGAEPAWFVENDSAASKVLAHHWPDVPNHGDVTSVEDWGGVEPVQVLTGGFPCTDVSCAGRRAGLRPGTRSGLWSHMAYAISQLRPELVVIENVRGLLSADAHCDLEPCPWCVGDDEGRPLRACGAVVGDLANLGYVGRIRGLRASDIGAPHGRFRVFICAWPATDTDPSDRYGPWATGSRRSGSPDRREPVAHAASQGRGSREQVNVGQYGGEAVRAGETEPRRRDSPAADSDGEGCGSGSGVGRPTGSAAVGDRAPLVADSASDGRGEGRTEPARVVGGSDAAQRGNETPTDTDGSGFQWNEGDARWSEIERVATDWNSPSGVDWGSYSPAIDRWARILGRPAPAPTVTGKRGGQQLSSVFVEWMQGWPKGWVTDVPGLSRNAQLKICGNGVVPQQAAAALAHLLPVTDEAAS